LLLANALTGSGDDVWVRGPIMKTDTRSGRLVGAINTVTIQYNDCKVKFQVTSCEYDAAKQSGYYFAKDAARRV